jgi:hypothetical protein
VTLLQIKQAQIGGIGCCQHEQQLQQAPEHGSSK